MRDLEYAREGFCFYAVVTPFVFLEYELPNNVGKDFTPREHQKWQELEDLADLHRTHVSTTPYRRG
jgi:hypothetical protein